MIHYGKGLCPGDVELPTEPLAPAPGWPLCCPGKGSLLGWEILPPSLGISGNALLGTPRGVLPERFTVLSSPPSRLDITLPSPPSKAERKLGSSSLVVVKGREKFHHREVFTSRACPKNTSAWPLCLEPQTSHKAKHIIQYICETKR